LTSGIYIYKLIKAAAGLRFRQERHESGEARHFSRPVRRYGFDAALVAEDVSHSTVTETRWSYLGPIDGVLHVGIVTYRGNATRVISLRRASRHEREKYEQAHRRP
jgi:uncharacterized DUF497 family protein